MTIEVDSRRGRTALMVAHCAGLVDLVALPLWVGVLIGHLGFDPQQAGGLVTLFLAGVVLASVGVAPLFNALSGRSIAVFGYAISAACLLYAAQVKDYGTLAALHAIGGFATGAALSVTHGSMARSINPHRLFAIGGAAMGVFGLAFMAATPQILAAFGGQTLFLVLGTIMAVAAVAALLAFPFVAKLSHASAAVPSRLSPAVWFGIGGVACMALVQAMTFSFLERAGMDRGFGAQAVAIALVCVGVFNLLPGPLAAILEKRLNARSVLMVAPIVHSSMAAIIMLTSTFIFYAGAASMLVFTLVFMHVFAFGLLAKLDPSSRSLAATPAMLMVGSAIGPVLGGTLVKMFGYGAIAAAAGVAALFSVYCFSRMTAKAEVRAVPVEVSA